MLTLTFIKCKLHLHLTCLKCVQCANGYPTCFTRRTKREISTADVLVVGPLFIVTKDEAKLLSGNTSMIFITDKSKHDTSLNTNHNEVVTISDLKKIEDYFNNPLFITALVLCVITIVSISLVSILRSRRESLNLLK